MTNEQIIEFAKTCGITPNKYKVCIIWKEELLKFALVMYNHGICEGAYQQSKRYMEGVFDDD